MVMVFMSVKVFGNPILGFRVSDGSEFKEFFENSEIKRLELKSEMIKELKRRFG